MSQDQNTAESRDILTVINYDGQMDNSIFIEFLQAYPTLWHYCHAKGRVNSADLYDAECSAINFAKQFGFDLVFDEMAFTLSGNSD